MKIKFYKRQNYGRTDEYVADDMQQKQLQFLTGRKTVTQNDRNVLTKLFGVEWVEIVAP